MYERIVRGCHITSPNLTFVALAVKTPSKAHSVMTIGIAVIEPMR